MQTDKPNLFRDDSPKYIRCYDAGDDQTDRYTVTFTGRYRRKTGGEFIYLAMGPSPYHGFGQHGSSRHQVDRPRSRHLGRKIPFAALPSDCRHLVMSDYCDLWDAMRPPSGNQE